ncbi:Saccharopine dehydrogenase-domain-containing protein [Calycina marina]|uniref:Saccharopine dehydrogenase-domain-containing protein n=1 Tax=Calycina marina TaxID=1763456 RepID=A0A9P7Z8E7_9HELO|nr:Saccharopine dehydrogenase-domain-containing protein [Calycina marina]
MSSRQYDIVVFGLGYTGNLTAEHIAQSLPIDLKWALAGRTESKLRAVAEELKFLNPDRIQPGIEICNLNDADLSALAKKTKLMIATVGPYGRHGEHAFKACAENGTHYLDVTGEIPFVADMIRKYERSAKASGSIMFSQIGIESGPPDLIAWSLVESIKKRFSAPTGEVVVCLHDISAKPSGGTLSSALSFMENFTLKQIKESMIPYAISPASGPKVPSPISWTTKIFGIRAVRDLGILTTAIQASSDVAIVQRSWGFLNYGPKFQYHEYMKSRNYLTGILTHFAILAGGIILAIPFLRNTAKRFVVQPGHGPTKEESSRERFEFRGIGTPDVPGQAPARAYCKFSYQGSLYTYTGISLAEAAISILRDDHKLGGGIYTPAVLGQQFVDRLQANGVKIENGFYED